MILIITDICVNFWRNTLASDKQLDNNASQL